MDLRDKVVVITGSAGGLGKEFADRLLKLGSRVCIADIKTEALKETFEEFAGAYGADNVHFERCDVTKEEDIQNLWDSTVKKFRKEIDVFVNNAGIMGEKEGWAYNTSKSAVVTMTRCIGNEETFKTQGVKVMALCPSVTKTPILDGCTKEELLEMEKGVGGFMPAKQVGDAFLSLLQTGCPGSVMAVWKDCPPYLIPDTSFGLFVIFTTFAMVCKYVTNAIGWPTVVRKGHMLVCAVMILLSWVLMGQIILGIYHALM